MKKIIALLILAFLVMPLFAEVVKSDVLTSRYGISYEERQKSNYIVKNGRSFSYLGNGTWEVKTISTNNSSTNSYSSSTSKYIFVIIIIAIIHIIITVCIANAKGGGWAALYFFLAPIALFAVLGGAGGVGNQSTFRGGGVKINKKRYEIKDGTTGRKIRDIDIIEK